MTKYPPACSPKFSKDFDGKAFSNILKLFYICLELPSDSEKYFGFVVDEFSELVHTTKCDVRDTELFVATPASQNELNLDGISHSWEHSRIV